MKIITKSKEQKLAEHIDNIFMAIASHDDMLLLQAVEDVFEIAYGIGGFKLVSSMHTKHLQILNELQEGEGK